ncbi:hypothetical protein OJAV_G00171910 [Oryzias javanicus]|uniref:Sushi domain-containing protein n=1 Tax=Oryzias javanicus TaxID=123683 RepID=A0A437CG30_ORYJA|nr:hypothetical protein OJAV_G00171910 [Oryzias javanicus]
MWFPRLLLLAWFPGVLHAQTAAGSCARPELTNGFLVSDQQSYPHEENVAYACHNGFKSALDGWWGTSTCNDGTWFPDIFCIDKNFCVPPEIPHGKSLTPTGWFEEKHKLRVDCDQGYRPRSLSPQPQCIKGSWDLIPVCEKKADACDRPPKILNATIIHEATQKVFAEGSRLQYKCKDGHSIEKGISEEFITCSSGKWTTALPCSPSCVMKKGRRTYIELREDEHFMEGETKSFYCGYRDYEQRAHCINSQIRLTQCCHRTNFHTGNCGLERES